MKTYQLTCLISLKLSDEEMKKNLEKITSLIQEEEGILIGSKNPIKKKLAHPIKKEELAYLNCLDFNLSPEKLENLEKKLKSESQILRFLISIKKEEKINIQPEKTSFKADVFSPETKKSLKTASPEEEKVELEEIEQKLEEILGEI